MMKEFEYNSFMQQEEVLPRLWNVRRVPERYCQLLPIAFMKKYECVIVGANRRTLTVAVSDPKRVGICRTISELTGCTIFPVLLEPTKVRLLVKRIERSKHNHYDLFRRSSFDQWYYRSLMNTCACLDRNCHHFG